MEGAAAGQEASSAQEEKGALPDRSWMSAKTTGYRLLQKASEPPRCQVLRKKTQSYWEVIRMIKN